MSGTSTRNRGFRASSQALWVGVVLSTILTHSDPSGGVTVRVRGKASIEARASLGSGRVLARGLLRDDAGQSIPGGQVQLELLDEANRPIRGLPRALPCDSPSGEAPTLVLGKYNLPTDKEGRFCVRFGALTNFTHARISYAGNQDYAAATRTLALSGAKSSLILRFDRPPRSLPLELPRHTLFVETRLESEKGLDPPTGTVAVELRMQRSGGEIVTLARDQVRPGQRAQFVVATEKLGGPGPLTLIAHAPLSEHLQESERRERVQVTAVASLQLGADMVAADPRDGIPIDIVLSSDAGPVPVGSVEALVGGQSVGVADIVNGTARVEARFDPGRVSGPIPITLRYLPGAPWWLPGAPLDVQTNVLPPSPWRRLPWTVGGLLLAAWLVRAWLRPGRRQLKSKDPAKTSPTGRASIDIVEASRDPGGGWSGSVVDAHEGTPVPNADIQLIVPAFAGDGIAAETTTDADGRFDLGAVPNAQAEGSRLEIKAEHHSTLTRPVPSPGRLAIQLVSRRRTVLERLVEWSRRQGRPWIVEGEATPGHVRQVARAAKDAEIAEWAREVDEAAFGPHPPEASDEARLRAAEPEADGR